MKVDYLLNESIQIGNKILSLKKKESKGCVWKTVTTEDYPKIKWTKTESIYSGVGGIVLFLLELYNQTTTKKFLSAAEDGLTWLLNQAYGKNGSSNFSFYSGSFGLIYILLRAYDITNNKYYKDSAIKIAKFYCHNFKHSFFKRDDLVSGTGGILFILSYLHSRTKVPELLPVINDLIKHLIENVNHGKEGVYWDKNKNQIKGICGFAHGAAGVGYVFLELGSYFKNPALFWIAEQAFSYENQFIDRDNKNWLDFRKGIYHDIDYINHELAFLNQDMKFFYEVDSKVTAWCHGSPGIGLSRLAAWKHIKTAKYKRDINLSIISTKKEVLNPIGKSDTFTLCHGQGGCAILFLELYKQTGNTQALKWALQVAKKAIKFKKVYGKYLPGLTNIGSLEDISLFNGNAGIGYYYLMCNNPKQIPSVVAPTIDDCCSVDVSSYKHISINLEDLKNKVLQQAYPRTTSVFINLEKDVQFIDHNNTNDIKYEFRKKIKEYNKEYLNDIFDLENVKFNLELDNNPAYQNIKTKIFSEKVNKSITLKEDEFLAKKMIINKDVTFYKSKWFWPINMQPNFGEEQSQGLKGLQYYIFLKTPIKILEFPISLHTHSVLRQFLKPISSEEVINKMIKKNYTMNNITNKEEYATIILNQIKEFFRSLIIVPHVEESMLNH